MKGSYLQQLLLMVRRLLLAYGLYFTGRLVFYACNHAFFSQVRWYQFLEDAFFALRFDSFSIALSNSLFILLSALPSRVFWTSTYQKILRWLFMLGNILFTAFDFIDAAYFPFIRKRSTSDILEQMGGQTDMVTMLPRFVADYWWLLVLYVLLTWLLHRAYLGLRVNEMKLKDPKFFQSVAVKWICYLLVIGFSVLAVRGGLQRVPIDIVNAGSVTRPGEAPIVLNSSFSIIKSITQSNLPEIHYYSEKECRELYSPLRAGKPGKMNRKNVVVLILESFSKEYTSLGNRKSVTPFFDSLMEHSLVFRNAFSNGTKSIEGIPAILSSLPSLMKNPFINSVYANDHQNSFPILLKKEGYHSAFFHGGINGTMNFNDWAATAGYDEYLGKNEYGNDADFDGYWGIWDEPFLQYSVRKMNEFKEPFHSAIFTLSSHHPYFVPGKYKGYFPKGKLENAESIGYADHSLKLFFNTAQKQKWFSNTIFVLVADHTGISEDPYYTTINGLISIPVAFYVPGDSLKGMYHHSFSQMDILPSVLDYLNYPHDYFSFGEPYQYNKAANDYVYINDVYYLVTDSMITAMDTGKVISIYNFLKDSFQTNEIHAALPQYSGMRLKYHKAFLQEYNNRIIRNEMK